MEGWFLFLSRQGQRRPLAGCPGKAGQSTRYFLDDEMVSLSSVLASKRFYRGYGELLLRGPPLKEPRWRLSRSGDSKIVLDVA